MDKYFNVYTKLTEHREGCISSEIYESINSLLVEDYNASINNLEHMSKISMKYLKKKNKIENKRIFWYRIRRFFRFKKNEDIEELIKKREKYNLEFAYLFEDIISSKIRNLVELEDISEEDDIEEEPDFASTPEELFDGPKENRPLYPEVLENEELGYNEKQGELTYTNEIS